MNKIGVLVTGISAVPLNEVTERTQLPVNQKFSYQYTKNLPIH